MSVAGLQSALTTELGSITPPYTQSDIRDRIARAIHAGVGTIVSFTAQHNVQALVAAPGGTARGFQVLEAFDGSGNPLSVLGSPKINRTVGGGNIGLTVQYAPPLSNYLSAVVTSSSPVTLASTTVAQNINSLSLPVGVWDASAEFGYLDTTGAYVSGSINDASATLSGNYGNQTWEDGTPAVAYTRYKNIVGVRYVVTGAAKTIYQVIREDFSGGTHYAFGRLSAVCVAPDPATTGTVRGILWDG